MLFSLICNTFTWPLSRCSLFSLFGVVWNETQYSVCSHKISIVIPINLAGSHFFWTTHVGSYSAVSSRTNTPNPFSGQQQPFHPQISQQLSRREEHTGILWFCAIETYTKHLWRAYLFKWYSFNCHAFSVSNRKFAKIDCTIDNNWFNQNTNCPNENCRFLNTKHCRRYDNVEIVATMWRMWSLSRVSTVKMSVSF